MPRTSSDHRWTRRGLVRAAVVGGALGGGVASSLAATSPDDDTRILNLFLALERVQLGLYRAALERAGLTGELLEYADAAAGQEAAHVAFLERRLGAGADAAPATRFDEVTGSAARFRDTALDVEEAALAAYVGQAANLTRETVAPVAVLVSVDARQAAWIRDIAGVSPAPRAADPGRPGGDVLAELRRKGILR